MTYTVCNTVTHSVRNDRRTHVQNQNQNQNSTYGGLWLLDYSRIRSNGDLGAIGFGAKQ